MAKKNVKVAILGPVGNGKSVLVLSLFKALFQGDARRLVANLRLSSRLRQLLERFKTIHEPPDRTVVEESLSFSWKVAAGEIDVDVLSLAGEDLRTHGQLSVAELRSKLDRLRVDIVVITVNPHEIWPELSEQALDDMLVTWLQRGFTLGQALDQSASLLYGRSFKNLIECNLGIEDIDQRLLDLQPTLDEQPPKTLDALLETADVAADDREEFRRARRHLARAVCYDAGEAALLRDLAASFPRVVLCLTHIDLLEFLPNLTRGDYEQRAREFLPSSRRRLASDVVLARNLHLELRHHSTRPILYRDIFPDGGKELWRALEPHILECETRPIVDDVPADTWTVSRQLLSLGFCVLATLSLVFGIASLVLRVRNDELAQLATGFFAISMALLGCILMSSIDAAQDRKTIPHTSGLEPNLETSEAPTTQPVPADLPSRERVNAPTIPV